MINPLKYVALAINILVYLSMATVTLAQNNYKSIFAETQCNAIDHSDSIQKYLQLSSQSQQPLRNYARDLAVDYSTSNWLVLKRSFPEVADHIDYELHQAIRWANFAYQKCAGQTSCQGSNSWLQTKRNHTLQDFNGTWQTWQQEAENLGKDGLAWLDQKPKAGNGQAAILLMKDTLSSVQAPTSIIAWSTEVFGEATISFNQGVTEQISNPGTGLRDHYDVVSEQTKQAMILWMKELQKSSLEHSEFRKFGISAAMMSLVMRENNRFVQNIKLEQLSKQVTLLKIAENIIQTQEFLRRATHTQLGSYHQVASYIQHTQAAIQSQWEAITKWHETVQSSAPQMFTIVSGLNANLH